jgi:riboflavin biosynthesis pyrimidine reductase
MKPHVICHMVSSVDGRILSSRMRPKGANSGGLFERLHDELKGDAWLVGRVTGREFAKRESYPPQSAQAFPREHWFARRDAAAWGIALDRHGKIAWGRSDIGGDPIVVVLSEQVSDAHLAGLRSEQVSYIFAGKHDIDLGLALEILNRELGIKRLLLEGGGGSNGAFLRAGLVDEISLAILPAVDGAKGAPSVFDSSDKDAGVPARSNRWPCKAARCWKVAQSGFGTSFATDSTFLPFAESAKGRCRRLTPTEGSWAAKSR